MVDADELVVGARGKVATVWREADGVNGAQVVAHVAELSRLLLGAFNGIAVDGLSRPDAHMSITTRSREALAIGGDVTAVDLEVLLLAAMAQPCWLDDAHRERPEGI